MKLPRRTLLAGLAAGVAAPAILHWPAGAAEFTFKCGGSLPDGHPMAIRAREAMALIKEESGGRLDITLYTDRKSTRLNSSHRSLSRMPSSA